MDYTNFKPTYSYKYLALYELDLDTEEYWMPKLLQTRLKVKKLYSAMESKSTVAASHLLKKVRDLEWYISMWKLERTPTNPKFYQASNLVNSDRYRNTLPRVGNIRFLNGIPNEIWDNEGFLIVLPSQETIEWLNQLNNLFPAQQENVGF